MFIDKAKIYAKAGDGGDGCSAMLHEKYRPHGGPAGGDGGNGGDVILSVNPKLHTLMDFYYRRHFKAQNGSPGEGKCRHGKSGENLIIELPPGTVVFDYETGEQIADLIEDEFIIAKGGRGGKGNARFKSSSNQAPDYAQDGKPGEEYQLRLELRLIADIGLVGLPNAGKSTLISRLTKARPKIADYPFTTKYPHLGIAQVSPEKRLVIADIPGIIDGAHDGKGMGLDFLRHISRTKALVILLDILDKPVKAYKTLIAELADYDKKLLERPRIVALNKIDAADDRLMELSQKFVFDGNDVIHISAVTGKSLKKLLRRLVQLIDIEAIE